MNYKWAIKTLSQSLQCVAMQRTRSKKSVQRFAFPRGQNCCCSSSSSCRASATRICSLFHPCRRQKRRFEFHLFFSPSPKNEPPASFSPHPRKIGSEGRRKLLVLLNKISTCWLDAPSPTLAAELLLLRQKKTMQCRSTFSSFCPLRFPYLKTDNHLGMSNQMWSFIFVESSYWVGGW